MKVTTLNFCFRGKEDIAFSYDVNVSKDGTFTTTLPKEAVTMIESYGINLNHNRLGNPGYFSAKSMEELQIYIYNAVEEAVSCELVSTEDVIKYQILICAAYCRNIADKTDTELYPNGAYLNGKYQWVEGNVHPSPWDKHPTSFSVYVEPVSLKRYRYKSGKERIEETSIDVRKYPEGSAIRFINALVNNQPCNSIEWKQMPCTEVNAEFFKTAIISIWKINESLGKILNDDTLEQAIKEQQVLLLTPKTNKNHGNI